MAQEVILLTATRSSCQLYVHDSVSLCLRVYRVVNSAMCCVEVYIPLFGVNICKPQGYQARETEKAKVNPVLQALDRISV